MVKEAPDFSVRRNLVTDSEFHGATLGIVGMGVIGLKVAQRARAFGMNILYHNRRQR